MNKFRVYSLFASIRDVSIWLKNKSKFKKSLYEGYFQSYDFINLEYYEIRLNSLIYILQCKQQNFNLKINRKLLHRLLSDKI